MHWLGGWHWVFCSSNPEGCLLSVFLFQASFLILELRSGLELWLDLGFEPCCSIFCELLPVSCDHPSTLYKLGTTSLVCFLSHVVKQFPWELFITFEKQVFLRV